MARTSTSGQGRPKGVPNKFTQKVREAFERAFDALQQDVDNPATSARLEEWAKRNPTEFYKLAQRFVPAEVNAHVQGALTVVSGVPDADDDEPGASLV